jgi:limonene 1,2-monooxygenase
MLQSGLKAFSEVSYQEMIDERIVLVGSPSTVAEQIEELHQELGFGGMNLLMAIGTLSHENTIKSTDLFASEVIPKFREQRPAEEPALASR